MSNPLAMPSLAWSSSGLISSKHSRLSISLKKNKKKPQMKKTIRQLCHQWMIKQRRTKIRRMKNKSLRGNINREGMTIGAKAPILRNLSKMEILKLKQVPKTRKKSRNNINPRKRRLLGRCSLLMTSTKRNSMKRMILVSIK